MFNISRRIRPHVTSRMVRAGGRRSQSSQAGGGGPGKGLLVAAGTTTLVASVVGYSAWSDGNRKSVERIIPGSKYVLTPLLGPLVEVPPTPTKSEQGLLRKKLDREKKKQQEKAEESKNQSEAALESLPPAPPQPSTEEQQQQQQQLEGGTGTADQDAVLAPQLEGGEPAASPVVTEEADKPAISALEERLASAAVEEDVENAALSEALRELAGRAQQEVTAALTAAEDAARAVQRHAEKAYQAIDGGQDREQFEAVAELAGQRSQTVQEAKLRISAAGEAVEKYREQISAGAASTLTKDHPGLIEAQERIGDLKYALERTKALLSEAERDSKVVSSYRDLVEASREQFETEVRSLLPEVKLGETSDKLTTDELNLLLAHAHRKVMHLHNQLARLQTMEHERFKEALTQQRREDGHLLETKLEAELERQRQQLEVEYKRQGAELREEMEGELRTQLKRQAAAHSDHLADVLYVQEKELQNKWSSILQEELQTEKDKYFTSLVRIQGQLDGLKSALSQRAGVDKAALAARELWLACESLRNALRNSGDGSPSWEEQLKPLHNQINAIKTAAGERNPYVEAVLGSLSEEALERGVYTEEALRERFIKVERVCKRVSMIGDNGGSLLRYLLSYIQSFLVLNAFEYMPGNEVRNEEVAIDALSTYDILARARYCLEKDDLCMSVRYVNLLRGEPRHVAASWLHEARLTLEARQAAHALLAHAAATAAQAL